MDPPLWAAIIGGTVGLITGAIASLVAPWAQWGVEKKRIAHGARATMIAETRAYLADPPPAEAFQHTPIYARLRPHLSEGARNAVEKHDSPGSRGVPVRTITIAAGHGRNSGVNPYAARLLDELSDLEKSWGLI